MGVLTERSRKRGPVDPSSHLGGRIGWRAVWADLALAFVGAASVGALFLGVLLVVEVWRYEPLAGALVVSALPVATLAARRLGRAAPPMALLIGGVALIGAGLVALALLPASSAWYLGAALAVFGAGLGLVSDVLGPLSIPERGAGSAAHLSVSARHLGLVLGLIADRADARGEPSVSGRPRHLVWHRDGARCPAVGPREGAARVGDPQRPREDSGRTGA